MSAISLEADFNERILDAEYLCQILMCQSNSSERNTYLSEAGHKSQLCKLQVGQRRPVFLRGGEPVMPSGYCLTRGFAELRSFPCGVGGKIQAPLPRFTVGIVARSFSHSLTPLRWRCYTGRERGVPKAIRTGLRGVHVKIGGESADDRFRAFLDSTAPARLRQAERRCFMRLRHLPYRRTRACRQGLSLAHDDRHHCVHLHFEPPSQSHGIQFAVGLKSPVQTFYGHTSVVNHLPGGCLFGSPDYSLVYRVKRGWAEIRRRGPASGIASGSWRSVGAGRLESGASRHDAASFAPLPASAHLRGMESKSRACGALYGLGRGRRPLLAVALGFLAAIALACSSSTASPAPPARRALPEAPALGASATDLPVRATSVDPVATGTSPAAAEDPIPPIVRQLNPSGPKVVARGAFDQLLSRDGIRPVYRPLVVTPEMAALDSDDLVTTGGWMARR